MRDAVNLPELDFRKSPNERFVYCLQIHRIGPHFTNCGDIIDVLLLHKRILEWREEENESREQKDVEEVQDKHVLL